MEQVKLRSQQLMLKPASSCLAKPWGPTTFVNLGFGQNVQRFAAHLIFDKTWKRALNVKQLAAHEFPIWDGSKLNHQGTTGFSHCFHFQAAILGTCF